MKLHETFVKTLSYKKGKAVNFQVDQIKLPNGELAIREFLDHPGAVGVIPVLPDGKIVMVEQYRHPVRKITWEIPAGKLDKGSKESIIQCAKRELEEETGYTAKRYKKLLAFWPTAAFANEIIHIFIATELSAGKINLDEDEFVECFEITLNQALNAIKTGKIQDSKTIIALLAYKTYCQD